MSDREDGEPFEAERRGIGIAGPDTELLAERIREMKVGDMLTYGAMTKMLGYDVRAQKGRGRMGSARRIAERNGVVTE